MVDENYLIGSLLLVVGIHFTAYLAYLKVKHDPSMRGYVLGIPGPGYKAYRRFYSDPKYLIISVAATLLLLINWIFGVRDIMREHTSSHSILYVAPVASVLVYSLALYTSKKIFPRY